MRMRHKPWAEQMLRENDAIAITYPEEHRGNWKHFFNNTNPLHLEIGTGKGQFIAGMAKAYPAINFVGLEQQTSVIVSALDKIIAEKVANAILLNKNARELISFFAPGELDIIYLNFSDPWPKKKHAKRRLTHLTFLEIYQQVLKQGGEIHLKTDNEKLFEFSLNSLAEAGFRLKNICFDLHQSAWEGNIKTEYEEKFSQQGMKIFRCEAIVPAT